MEGAVSGDGSTPGPPKKRTRDDKYAIPTMEEGRLLRESEGQLSRGNLLRLETEELLGEVRVDHGKKSVKAIEVISPAKLPSWPEIVLCFSYRYRVDPIPHLPRSAINPEVYCFR